MESTFPEESHDSLIVKSYKNIPWDSVTCEKRGPFRINFGDN